MGTSAEARGTRRVTVIRRGAGDDRPVDDTVLVEGPLEIVVDAVSVATTMRTPGDDDLLALGFSMCEGLIPEGCEPVVEIVETEGDGARVLVTTGNLFPQQVGPRSSRSRAVLDHARISSRSPVARMPPPRSTSTGG